MNIRNLDNCISCLGKTSTLQHPKRERACVPGHRQVSVHVYDVIRLYETAGGEKQEGSGAGPTVRSSASVDRDSRGYVLMKGLAKQTETKRVAESSVLRSDDVAAGYMEMKKAQKSETKTSAPEQTDSHEPRLREENSCYVNTSDDNAESRNQTNPSLPCYK